MLRPVTFQFDKVTEWNEWRKECIPRLKYAARLKQIRHLPELTPHDGNCVIVGAGPSLEQQVDTIRQLAKGGKTFLLAVNAVHQWLIDRDIIPSAHVVFEPDIEDLSLSLGRKPHPDVVYYIASHCPPHVFKSLANYQRVLWHAYCPAQGYQNAIARYFKDEFMVAGGYCTFFRSLTIAIVLGFRDFDLFGIDSSFEDSSHLDGYKMANIEPKREVYGTNPYTGELRKFTTQGGLAYQAVEFLKFCEINQAGLKLRVHGDTLLRYLHESRYPEQYNGYQPKL